MGLNFTGDQTEVWVRFLTKPSISRGNTLWTSDPQEHLSWATDPSAPAHVEAAELRAALLPVPFPSCLCSAQRQQLGKGRNSHTSERLGLAAVARSLAADEPGFGCCRAANPLGGQSRSSVAACTLLSSSFPIVNWP